MIVLRDRQTFRVVALFTNEYTGEHGGCLVDDRLRMQDVKQLIPLSPPVQEPPAPLVVFVPGEVWVG